MSINEQMWFHWRRDIRRSGGLHCKKGHRRAGVTSLWRGIKEQGGLHCKKGHQKARITLLWRSIRGTSEHQRAGLTSQEKGHYRTGGTSGYQIYATSRYYKDNSKCRLLFSIFSSHIKYYYFSATVLHTSWNLGVGGGSSCSSNYVTLKGSLT